MASANPLFVFSSSIPSRILQRSGWKCPDKRVMNPVTKLVESEIAQCDHLQPASDHPCPSCSLTNSTHNTDPLVSPLSSIVNFRDVSSIVNHSSPKRCILAAKLYRSARPDEATALDKTHLLNNLHIKTIIDLRTATEHQEQRTKHATLIESHRKAQKRSRSGTALSSANSSRPYLLRSRSSISQVSTETRNLPATSHSNNSTATVNSLSSSSTDSTTTSSVSSKSGSESKKGASSSLRIPGISYVPINFNGSAYQWHMISKLSWTAIFQVIGQYAFGTRLDAIRVLVKHAMLPRGLPGLAVDTLDVCKAEVKLVFDVLAVEENYPVLVHCTQGKDRTGLVIQLVLQLLGASKEAIMADYMATNEGLKEERPEKLKELHKIGLTDEFADCNEEVVNQVYQCIREKYGGIEEYLEKCGVGKKMQDEVKRILAC